jgi:hypothetical protein
VQATKHCREKKKNTRQESRISQERSETRQAFGRTSLNDGVNLRGEDETVCLVVSAGVGVDGDG